MFGYHLCPDICGSEIYFRQSKMANLIMLKTARLSEDTWRILVLKY
jgi:hypothetical protein